MEILKIDRKTVQIEFTLDEFVTLTSLADTADSNFEVLNAELCQLTEETVTDFAKKIFDLQKSANRYFQDFKVDNGEH